MSRLVMSGGGSGGPDGPADALAPWGRPGVVKAPMAHYCLARFTWVQRQEAPDLLAALAEVDIEQSSARFGPGMEATPL